MYVLSWSGHLDGDGSDDSMSDGGGVSDRLTGWQYTWVSLSPVTVSNLLVKSFWSFSAVVHLALTSCKVEPTTGRGGGGKKIVVDGGQKVKVVTQRGWVGGFVLPKCSSTKWGGKVITCTVSLNRKAHTHSVR